VRGGEIENSEDGDDMDKQLDDQESAEYDQGKSNEDDEEAAAPLAVPEEEEENDDDNDDDDDDEEDDEEGDESFGLLKSMTSLKVDSAIMDASLHTYQVMAKRGARAYGDLLAQVPQLNLVLSNPMILRTLVMIFMSQVVAKKLSDSPSVVFKIRLFYTCSMALVHLSLLLIRHSIVRTNDQTEVRLCSLWCISVFFK
jgi:hypothetical protein